MYLLVVSERNLTHTFLVRGFIGSSTNQGKAGWCSPQSQVKPQTQATWNFPPSHSYPHLVSLYLCFYAGLILRNLQVALNTVARILEVISVCLPAAVNSSVRKESHWLGLGYVPCTYSCVVLIFKNNYQNICKIIVKFHNLIDPACFIFV